MTRVELQILRTLAQRSEWVESPFCTEHCARLVEDELVESRPGNEVGVLALRITDTGREHLHRQDTT